MGCCGDRAVRSDRVLASAKTHRISMPKDAFLVIAVDVEEGEEIVGKASGHRYPPARIGELITMRRDDFELDTRFVRYGKDTARLAR